MSSPGTTGPYRSYQTMGRSRISTPPKSASRSALTPSPQDPITLTPSPPIRFGNGTTRRRRTPAHLAAIESARALEPGPLVQTPPQRPATPRPATPRPATPRPATPTRREIRFNNSRFMTRTFNKLAGPPNVRRSTRNVGRSILRRRSGNLNSNLPGNRATQKAYWRAALMNNSNF